MRILLLAGVDIQPDDLAARCDQTLDAGFVEVEHLLEHDFLVPGEHTADRALVDQHAQILVGDQLLLGDLDPQNFDHTLGGPVQEAHQRASQSGQHPHDRGSHLGEAFRVGDRQFFGDQFAEHDRQVGDHQYHQRNADRFSVGLKAWDAGQQRGDLIGKGRAAERAGCHANQGDAELHGRDEAAGFFSQVKSIFCAGLTFIGLLLQAHLVGEDDGHLRESKVAVNQHEQNEDGKFEYSGHGICLLIE